MTITNTISHIVFHMKEKCNMCKVCGSCIFGQLLKGFQPEGLYFGVCFFPARCGVIINYFINILATLLALS